MALVLPKLTAVPEGQNQGPGSSARGGSSSSSCQPLPVLVGGAARRSSRQGRSACSQETGSELADVKLSQYFDDLGKPRFRSLGLTFVAKQSAQFARTFGSRSEVMREPENELSKSSRSMSTYFLAAEARQRDFEVVQQRTVELLNSIQDKQRYQNEEVQKRQLEVLFSEILDFRRCFPAQVSHVEVLPVDVEVDAENRYRKDSERSLDFFADPFWKRGKEMKWLLPRSGVLLLWQMASLWMQAARGLGNHLGIDRPTFCRFLLDYGLVDQNKVPLFWAATLFDDLARPMRSCLDVDVKHLTPAQPLVCWWDFISILNLILTQHFDATALDAFVGSLFPIAKMRLPAFVVEESGLTDCLVEDVIAGDAPATLFRTHTPEEADPFMQKAPLRLDKAALSPQEIRRLETMRERLVRSLLIEPEVLHMVLQHQEVFQKLYSCYSDGQGDMDFPALLQFCVDFQLTPALVPASFVHRVFETTHCVTLRPMKPPDSPRLSTLRVRRNVSEKAPMSGRARVGMKMLLSKDRAGTPKPRSAGTPKPRSPRPKPGTVSSQWTPRHRPYSASSVSSSASTAATTATSATTTPSPVAGISGPGSPTPGIDAVALDLPWRRVAKLAEQAALKEQQQSNSLCPAAFGVSAFTEALCFIVFSYLESYGNLQQKSMSGLPRMVWLMTYFSSVIDHLHRGLEKHADMDPPLPQGPLQAALQSLPSGEDIWAGTSFPSGMPLSPTVFRLTMAPDVHSSAKRRRTRTGAAAMATARTASQPPQYPGVEDKARTMRSSSKRGCSEHAIARRAVSKGDSSVAEWYLSSKDGLSKCRASGTVADMPPKRDDEEYSRAIAQRAVSKKTPLTGMPCIVQEVCRVCGRKVQPNGWGHARCHGCSVVDMLSFKDHPFKPLLLHWLGNVQPARLVGHWPSKVPRSALTPPPFGRSDVLSQ